tara:strand:- start:173 stop:517 length:345 start_codon:yes stop_codon:yes gene_type:complete
LRSAFLNILLFFDFNHSNQLFLSISSSSFQVITLHISFSPVAYIAATTTTTTQPIKAHANLLPRTAAPAKPPKHWQTAAFAATAATAAFYAAAKSATAAATNRTMPLTPHRTPL